MPLDRTDVEAALQQKGFQCESGKDHRYFTYYTTQNKKSSIYTKTSHGTKYKKLGDDLVSQMSKQCKLSTKQFKELVTCTLSRDSYEACRIADHHVTLDKPENGN
jgi:hypothetical protein